MKLKITGAILVVLFLFVGLPIGIYTLTYASAPIRGKIALHNQIYDPLNIQQVYEHFHDLHGTILSQEQQVQLAEGQLKTFEQTNPQGTSDPFGNLANQKGQLISAITGIQQLCVQNVNQYNEDTHKYTEQPFLDHNLPFTINSKDCEINS